MSQDQDFGVLYDYKEVLRKCFDNLPDEQRKLLSDWAAAGKPVFASSVEWISSAGVP